MNQLESIIDKDEYDLSNFEEKIQKREEQLKLSSDQIFEEPQFQTTEKKNSMPDVTSKSKERKKI